MGHGRTERCLKLGLGDEINSVKETKKQLQFPILDYEITGARYGAPNPAFRLDFRGTCQSFEPTNGTRRPPDRIHQISQQSEQVIPRTDMAPHPSTPARRQRRATSRAVTRPGCSDASHTPLVTRLLILRRAQLGRTLPRRALFGPALFA